MILLDTNVVSEVMARRPAEAVVQWLDHQPTEALYLSAITIAEISYGLHGLPPGKRRQGLQGRFDRFIAMGFSHRILVFGEEAARAYGEIMGHRRRRGRPMSALDGQIAAIARVHRFAMATRNVDDFEECGLDIVNPFD